jgi:hypothetical protein
MFRFCQRICIGLDPNRLKDSTETKEAKKKKWLSWVIRNSFLSKDSTYGTWNAIGIRFLIIHIEVIVDEECLHRFDELDGHI